MGEYKFARLLDAGEPGVLSALLSHRFTQKVAQQPASLIKAVGWEGRLRCSFNPTGTVTVRFSSTGPLSSKKP